MDNSRFPECGRRAQDHAQARSRAHRRTWGVLALALLVVVSPCWLASTRAGQGDGVISREHPLKALFLYNFGGYVEWPQEAFPSGDTPFVIGILGSAPLDETLREIAMTKKVAGRRIVVKQFTSIDGIEPCHILFIARGIQPHHERQVVESLHGHPVLIVGETAGFGTRGGCVNFYIESNKIRLEINLEATKQQQLKMSAKLLALAKIVP